MAGPDPAIFLLGSARAGVLGDQEDGRVKPGHDDWTTVRGGLRSHHHYTATVSATGQTISTASPAARRRVPAPDGSFNTTEIPPSH